MRCHPLLPALLLVALGAAAWAAAPARRFRDVRTNHWAASAIAQVAQNGIMGATGRNTFQPNQPVTRAELAVILVRAIHHLESRGPVKISTSPAKPEVPPAQTAGLARHSRTHPAYPALDRLVKGGYLIPDAQGKAFFPPPETIDQPVTAAEVATAVAGVMIRITEKRNALEHPETLQEGDRPETRDNR
jgi:hypothetical protein